jgi:hypothetical protein
MARRLFTVEETFKLKNRGTILVPGVLPEGDERFRIGDPLRVLRPDRSELMVAIVGFHSFDPGPCCEYTVLVALPKSEIPIGSAVWSL